VTEYIFPWDASATISQYFGWNKGGLNPIGGHTAIDAALEIGTPLRAPADGTVVFAQEFARMDGADNPWLLTPGGGKVIGIDAGPGKPLFIMAHLSAYAAFKGQTVKQGDIVAYSGNSGTWTTGPHCHFEVMPDQWNLQNGTYGRVDPAWYCKGYWSGAPILPMSANQRLNGPQVTRRRVEANTSSAVYEEIPAGQLEVFTGYVIGEDVNGINIWFKDDNGYAWAGGFESQSIVGLPNLTPEQVLLPNQRETAGQVTLRNSPDKNATATATFPADRVLDFKGYVRGTQPYPDDSNNVWFVGAYSDSYVWSGAFKDTSTTGLTFLGPSSPATPTPAPVEAYSFVADFDFARAVPAHLSNVQRAQDNSGVLVFPVAPSTAVCHWWGDPMTSISMQSVIGEFQRENSFKSAHFVVSLEIIQMVSLKDRAYHAGAAGNGWVGIEVDPRAYGTDETAKLIQANVRKLLTALKEAKYSYQLALTLHKDVPGNNTNCSSLRLSDFDITPPPVVVVPPVVVPPVVVPPTTSPLDEAGVLGKFFAWLISMFLNRDKAGK